MHVCSTRNRGVINGQIRREFVPKSLVQQIRIKQVIADLVCRINVCYKFSVHTPQRQNSNIATKQPIAHSYFFHFLRKNPPKTVNKLRISKEQICQATYLIQICYKFARNRISLLGNVFDAKMLHNAFFTDQLGNLSVYD